MALTHQMFILRASRPFKLVSINSILMADQNSLINVYLSCATHYSTWMFSHTIKMSCFTAKRSLKRSRTISTSLVWTNYLPLSYGYVESVSWLYLMVCQLELDILSLIIVCIFTYEGFLYLIHQSDHSREGINSVSQSLRLLNFK